MFQGGSCFSTFDILLLICFSFMCEFISMLGDSRYFLYSWIVWLMFFCLLGRRILPSFISGVVLFLLNFCFLCSQCGFLESGFLASSILFCWRFKARILVVALKRQQKRMLLAKKPLSKKPH